MIPGRRLQGGERPGHGVVPGEHVGGGQRPGERNDESRSCRLRHPVPGIHLRQATGEPDGEQDRDRQRSGGNDGAGDPVPGDGLQQGADGAPGGAHRDEA